MVLVGGSFATDQDVSFEKFSWPGGGLGEGCWLRELENIKFTGVK